MNNAKGFIVYNELEAELQQAFCQLKGKKAKGQTTIYKTLHRKLKIEQHELTFYLSISLYL
jgi:hypothetical protein